MPEPRLPANYAVILSTLALLASVVGAVWKVDEHFVSRAEFEALRADVTAIREHLGIPAPARESARPPAAQ